MKECIERNLIQKDKDQGMKLLKSAVSAGLGIEKLQQYAAQLTNENFFDIEDNTRDEYITNLRNEPEYPGEKFAY